MQMKKPILENKNLYIKDGNVSEFIEHVYYNKKAKKPWECNNLGDALKQYAWQGMDFEKTQSILLELATKLKTAVNNGNELETLRVSVDILKWGGVLNGAQGVVKLFLQNNLSRSIKEAVNVLTDEDLNLTGFSTHIEDHSDDVDDISDSLGNYSNSPVRYRMNASFTKIYSLYSERPFIIYDSRVAAALGLVVRRYWEENHGSAALPQLLSFSSLQGRSGNRNASANHVIFGKIRQELQHAQWNVRANWIIEAALVDVDYEKINKKMREVEAALFMIGYNVS